MKLKKQISILITQIFCCVACFAQTHTIDSLKDLLPSLKGKARIDCLNELGFEFSNRYWSKSKYQQTDTALFYTLQAQNESQQLLYSPGTGNAFQNRAVIEEEHGNFKTAEIYVRKALGIFTNENMAAEYHLSHLLLGWILHNRGFFAQSIQIYKKELPYYEAIKDTEHISSISRIMARAYDWQGNSEKAFVYFQKDFAIKKNPADAWGKRSSATLKAAVYMAAADTPNAAFYYKQAALFSVDQHAILESYHQNMAMYYSLQKKYDSALIEIRTGIGEIRSSDKDPLFRKVALMVSTISLSDLFLVQKNFDSVIACTRPAIIFFKKRDYVTALLPLLKTLAAAYREMNQYSNALYCTNQLLVLAQRSGARRFERDGYQLLWQIYSYENKSGLADKVRLKYLLLNDSLENDKYISQAAAWQAINDGNIRDLKFENQLKITEARSNAKLQFINNQKKTQLKWFLVAIAFIGLFIILIIRNNWLKRKKNRLQLMMTEANILFEKQKRDQDVAQLQQQKTELEMQALRAQMNPHFIFNCLSSINRYILINKTEEASDYLTKFSRLIRMALHNSEKSFITLENELEALRLYLDLERLRFRNAFNYRITCINSLDESSIFIPPMLIQPFAENAIWHGLMHKQGIGCLDIVLSIKEKILTCSITDNGIGRDKAAAINSKSAEKNKSMGVKVTSKRLELLNRNENEEAIFTTEDLVDDEGNPGGTKVILRIRYKSLEDFYEFQNQ